MAPLNNWPDQLLSWPGAQCSIVYVAAPVCQQTNFRFLSVIVVVAGAATAAAAIKIKWIYWSPLLLLFVFRLTQEWRWRKQHGAISRVLVAATTYPLTACLPFVQQTTDVAINIFFTRIRALFLRTYKINCVIKLYIYINKRAAAEVGCCYGCWCFGWITTALVLMAVHDVVDFFAARHWRVCS